MKIFMLFFIENHVHITSDTTAAGMNFSNGYALIAMVAFLILCYLIFALIKPEKF
jgi:K+-transporting ATPase KdpF subunit